MEHKHETVVFVLKVNATIQGYYVHQNIQVPTIREDFTCTQNPNNDSTGERLTLLARIKHMVNLSPLEYCMVGNIWENLVE